MPVPKKRRYSPPCASYYTPECRRVRAKRVMQEQLELRYKLIVKLAERKLFVTFTNVTTGSGATVFPSSPCCPAPARPCAVRHRFAYLPRRARRVYTAHSPTYPP